MENKLCKKLAEGSHVLGTFSELGNALSAEALGTSGLDFIVIDNEHGPFEAESSAEMIRACELTGMTALCRVRETSRPAVMKLLDCGAGGLIIPDVRSIDEVKEIVNWSKFFPIGRRGFCGTRKDGWGYAYPGGESFQVQMDYWNRETLLIPQCETAECLEIIEEVAAMQGVDGIMIGPFDLSISMEIPGEFENPKLKKAISRILKACKDNHKYAMIFTPDAEKIHEYYKQGFDIVCYSLDAAVLIDAYHKIVQSERIQNCVISE